MLPPRPKKGEVNIIPNIRVIAVLVVFTESVKKREQLLRIKDFSYLVIGILSYAKIAIHLFVKGTMSRYLLCFCFCFVFFFSLN